MRTGRGRLLRNLTALIAVVFLLGPFPTPPAGDSHEPSTAADRPAPHHRTLDAAPPPTAEPPPSDPAPPPATLAAATPTGPHGLLIGIDRAPGTPTLTAAVRDVETLHAALLGYGFAPQNVQVLTDAQADRTTILRAISELATIADDHPDAPVVFSFAGHTVLKNAENHIVAGDGALISASELAAALEPIRSPVWVALPTCYAAGFRVPGIVGPNRVVTFASDVDRQAYEATWYERSFLFQYMVKEAMLDGHAQSSVQAAFRYASDALAAKYPDHVPIMDDQHSGEFTLAPPGADSPSSASGSPAPPARAAPSEDHPRDDPHGTEPGREADDEPDRSSGVRVRVCGPDLRLGSCDR